MKRDLPVDHNRKGESEEEDARKGAKAANQFSHERRWRQLAISDHHGIPLLYLLQGTHQIRGCYDEHRSMKMLKDNFQLT